MSEFQPLRIQAFPQCGVICDGSLPIDGILLSLAMRNKYGSRFLSSPSALNVDQPLCDIPIEKRGSGDQWYYAASWAQWQFPVPVQTHWVKRYERRYDHLVDFQGKRGKVIIEQGPYKAYRMPLFGYHDHVITWFVVGDKDEIERLLPFATAIGKKTAVGNGTILKWTVEPWHADWSERGECGRLMRAIPEKHGILHAIRPPYWLPEHHTPCQLPERLV